MCVCAVNTQFQFVNCKFSSRDKSCGVWILLTAIFTVAVYCCLNGFSHSAHKAITIIYFFHFYQCNLNLIGNRFGTRAEKLTQKDSKFHVNYLWMVISFTYTTTLCLSAYSSYKNLIETIQIPRYNLLLRPT